jgi:predicted molibdopterin-dependent oxidoreductase YjgC
MKFLIDGREIEVKDKKTILEVARANGIYIPSLCDHPRLAPFTGCRLCLVEIKGRRGFSPSCHTIVEEGMEVATQTPQLQTMRRTILELILSEHPNACVICTEKDKCEEYKSTIRKVGEVTGCVLCPENSRCQLQEVAEALKIDKIHFPSLYRNLDVRKDDPFFDRNYNLCILCGRCVRICHELRGASVLSFIFRGPRTVVGTALDRTLLESGCQFCGACVDVCPTGALVERAIRPQILPDRTAITVCPLCSLGCELKVELRAGKILCSLPSEDGGVNQGQACIKGRFAIRDLVSSSRRIKQPLIRRNGELEAVSWGEALDFIAPRLKKYSPEEIAFVFSPQASVEDNYVLFKFARQGLKTKNVASFSPFSPLVNYWKMAKENGLGPEFNFKIEDISKAKSIFVIGTDIAVSHPILWLEIFKSIKRGASLVTAYPRKVALERFSSFFIQTMPGSEALLLGYLSKVLLENAEDDSLLKVDGFRAFKNSLENLMLSQALEKTGVKEEDLMKIAGVLLEKKPAVILFGPALNYYPWGKENLAALWNLGILAQAQLLPLTQENNERGLLEIWSNSEERGLAFNQVFQAVQSGKVKAVYSNGLLPPLGRTRIELLIVQDSFASENVQRADVVLPSTTFAETEGVFVNCEGRAQIIHKILEPLEEAKPDWWIVSQLAQRMGFKGFSHSSSSEVQKEIQKAIPGFREIGKNNFNKGRAIFIQERKEETKKFLPLEYDQSHLQAHLDYPFLMIANYSTDYYKSLDLTQEIKGLSKIRNSRAIKINPEDAKSLNVSEADLIEVESPSGKMMGIASLADSVPKGTVEACYFWNGDQDFNPVGIFVDSSLSSSLGAVPARITKIGRGK